MPADSFHFVTDSAMASAMVLGRAAARGGAACDGERAMTAIAGFGFMG
jgi:hypothetical protein